MTTPYSASDSGVPASRDDVQILVPVDGDPGNASTFNPAYQKLADYVQRIVKKAGFLDLASTWAALQTFTHRLVVSRQGGDSNPALAVTGGISTDTLAASGAGTFGGTVTGAHPFTLAASIERFFYLDAIELVPATPYTGTASLVVMSGAGPAEWRSGTTSVATTLNGRIMAPRGATVTAVEVEVSNADSVARTIGSIGVVVHSGGNDASAVTSEVLTGTGAGTLTSIAVAAGTASVWLPVPMKSGSFVMPENGRLAMCFGVPTTTSGGQVIVRGVRIKCVLSAIRDMT